MGILDIITGKDAAKAQARAQRYAMNSQDKVVQQAQQALADSNQQTEQSYIQALKYAEQAGRVLSDAEQRQIAEYNASQAAALEAIGVASEDAMALIESGRDDAIEQLVAGGQAAVQSFYDAAELSGGSLDAAIDAVRMGAGQAQDYLGAAREAAVGQFADEAQYGDDAAREFAALQGLLGPEAQMQARDRFQTDPGYQFMVAEGQKALETAQNARGDLYSGDALKELTRYREGIAQQEYDNYIDRFDRLMQQGMTASQAIAQIQSDFGGQQAGISERLGTNIGQIEGERAGMQERTGERVGNVLFDVGQGSAGLTDAAAARGADVATNRGANEASTIGAFSQARGGAIDNSASRRSGILLGNSDLATNRGRDINANRYKSLGYTTDATTGKANAYAQGEVGKADARAQGVSNILNIAGTAIGAVSGAPTSFYKDGGTKSTVGSTVANRLFT